MQEMEFAEAVWRLIEAIFEFGLPSELMRRMMVSRLYYAAYHVALLLLKNVGWTPPVGRGAHGLVLLQLQQHYVNTGQMHTDATNALERLMQLRVRSDYYIDLRLRERDVRRAMRLFRAFFDECIRILGVT
ncbi:hypothetical protein FJZ31_34020 [Candidatus Poribacteria bacterium]|nr:hypothetical protein [Candidatus Poribacteria bacterium]